MTLSAQNDGFFTTNYDEHRETTEWGNLPTLPGSHGLDYDYEAAPLGSGLMLLGGMALLYARRKKELKLAVSCQQSAKEVEDKVCCLLTAEVSNN